MGLLKRPLGRTFDCNHRTKTGRSIINKNREMIKHETGPIEESAAKRRKCNTTDSQYLELTTQSADFQTSSIPTNLLAGIAPIESDLGIGQITTDPWLFPNYPYTDHIIDPSNSSTALTNRCWDYPAVGKGTSSQYLATDLSLEVPFKPSPVHRAVLEDSKPAEFLALQETPGRRYRVLWNIS